VIDSYSIVKYDMSEDVWCLEVVVKCNNRVDEMGEGVFPGLFSCMKSQKLLTCKYCGCELLTGCRSLWRRTLDG